MGAYDPIFSWVYEKISTTHWLDKSSHLSLQ
jgi:hypothetical protein